MRHLDEILEPNLNKDYTYICELTSPYNTVVTQYDSTSLHLIGVRHVDGHYIHEHNDLFMKPKTIQCDSLDDVRDAVARLNHLSDNPKEGFVVTCNDTGIKVKFKNTVYLTIHRNLGSEELSDKTIKELVADGEESEVGVYFPDMESKFKDVVSKREVLIANIQKGLDLYHSTDDRKSLVDDLKELGIASFVFAAGKDGITNAREAWGKVNKKLRVNSL